MHNGLIAQELMVKVLQWLIPGCFIPTIEQVVCSSKLFKGVKKKIKQKTDKIVLFKMYNGL